MKLKGPLALVAELTHRCPLRCLYCSNPVALQARVLELSTLHWIQVFQEAAEIGVLQVHLTGGEPLLRNDLSELIAAAKSFGLYINLITSGVGLSESRIENLIQAGTHHFQLSFQAHSPHLAERICGARTHELKIRAAQMIRSKPVALTINVVVHRQNIDYLEEILQFAETFSPDKIEIAHTQYYGWALRNRHHLLPSLEQVKRSIQIVKAAQIRLQGRICIEFVTPDYFGKYPKPCMGGWGRNFIVVDPIGQALPCHAAASLPFLNFSNIKNHSLAWIWEYSPPFVQFRGDEWMKEPCRSCDRRALDFGGCRCQAFTITGDENAADPVCRHSSHHDKLREMTSSSSDIELQYRG
jgi:PqqA peptide cyclase